MIDRNEATNAQVRTANPANSTWVSANAGSGKTRVLTERVARLLVNGTDPSRILCLTYTKAAAAEMQNRLFGQLGSWSMESNEKLRELLDLLGENGRDFTDQELARTRTLFAAALETPGGLKIQTIHAFCTAVLQRFPLEAGLSPQFAVMEETEAKRIREELIDEIALKDASVLDRLAYYFTGLSVDSLIEDILFQRHKFQKEPRPEDFGIGLDVTPSKLQMHIFRSGNTEVLNAVIPFMNEKPTDIGNAENIKEAMATADPIRSLSMLLKVFITGSGENMHRAKIGKMPTKDALKGHDDLRAKVDAVAQELEDLRPIFVGAIAYQRSKVIFDFASEFLREYRNFKLLNAKLDYDDLIERTTHLLSSSSMAQWVLFRLDGGIDHILVDEAQDTSPTQWKIIEHLTAEFTSGEGSSEHKRTLFVVGDEKQSIYSFQGAEPDAFGEMKERFSKRLKDAEQELHSERLVYSFRSAAPILQLVDEIMMGEGTQNKLPQNPHIAFHQDLPGRVDLWPLFQKDEEPEEKPWFEPLNMPSPDDPRIKLAREIAVSIRKMIDEQQPIKVDGDIRPVTEGDILILVQNRSLLFHFIIKELKALDLNIAGADRLKIGQELAVKDIVSTLKFLATPEDDLSLAEALRSPIFGLTEQDLFTLAHDRTGYLWASLRASDAHAAALEILWDLLEKSDFLRPFELVERILTHHGGRQKILARLGLEVEEALDALVEQTLHYESLQAPTLSGFLNWFENSDVEVKRNLLAGNNQIRVMTIHGAKGLEAPVVFLPDTLKYRQHQQSPFAEIEPGLVSWPADKNYRTVPEEEAISLSADKQRQENMRKLYVALTRAESWLIVCGAHSSKNKPTLDWHSLVLDAMTAACAEEGLSNGVDCLTLKNGFWDEMVADAPSTGTASEDITPAWLAEDAEKLERPLQPLAPSSLPGAKTIATEATQTNEFARQKGTLFHKLLEVLPEVSEKDRLRVATNICAEETELDNSIKDQTIESALSLISDPEFAEIFGTNSFSEVTLSATQPFPELPSYLGSIDRLVLSEHKIWIIDFKSNQIVPDNPQDVPLGILRQMAAYYLMVSQIYPDREIQLSILWTETTSIMTIPHEIVKPLLQSPLHLDPSQRGS